MLPCCVATVMLLPLGIVLVIAFFHVAFATLIDSDTSPARRLNLDPSDSFIPTATIPSFNASKSLNDSLAETTFLAHRFRVPDTNTVLGLGFGIFRHRVDATDLQSLIRLALGVAKEGVDHYGGAAEYELQGLHQSFEQTGFDLYLLIQDCNNGIFFNYQELYETLEGLMGFLVVGERNWETTFVVWHGPGRFPDLTDHPVARGKIRMMGRSSSMDVE